MVKKLSVAVLLLALASCANTPDQMSDAYMKQYCTFDPETFEKFPLNSPETDLCYQLWISGFDPDEDFHGGDDGGDND